MPVNPSDLTFFNTLSSLMEDSQADLTTLPTIDVMREQMRLFAPFVDDATDIPYSEYLIQTKDGAQITLTHYENGKEAKPLLIYLPGNGFTFDMKDENHTIISKIANVADAHAVMINYRIAPENPFPTPLNDALSAVEYIYSHLDAFNLKDNKCVIIGFSSGANLAAVISNQLRLDTNKPIFHQYLISGAYDYTNSLHDFDEFALEDKLLDPNAAEFSFDCYLQNTQRNNPSCSPYFEDDLSNLPPTTLMCGEYDGGRSHTEAYAKRLKEAGNHIDVCIRPGQTHGTILYRKACVDGEDPAVFAGNKLHRILYT